VFAGVPTLLKDSGAEEAGQPQRLGMRALRDTPLRPLQTSHLLQQLTAAGLVPLGRTNMPELAILATSEPDAYGPTRNPWNLEFTAGGSSGGSAAAVAAGIVPVAHASDGGGSIRGPANMCGLVGLKPSRGRISPGPLRGERWSSLAGEFMLTRSVRDCAALLDILGGHRLGDPYSAPPPAQAYTRAIERGPGALRIGVLASGLRGVALEPACAAAVLKVAKTLGELGHHTEESQPAALEEVEAPIVWTKLIAVNVARAVAECGQHLGRELGEQDLEPLTFALADRARSVPAIKHLEAIDSLHAYGRRLSAHFTTDFDLLLTPVQASPPPRIGHLTSTPEEPFRAMLRSIPYGIYTLPFNMSGQPAIALPATLSADGLPIGVQLIAAFGREDVLLQVAAQLESVGDWPRAGSA
jgi:amidase